MNAPPALSSANVRSVLGVKVDTLGDLIVFAPALHALREALPTARITMVIRNAYADLARQLVPKIEWVTTSLDPFSHGPQQDTAELRRLRDAAGALNADVVLASTSRRNWLEAVLAASTRAPRRIALGATTEDEFFATQLRVQFDIDARATFSEHLSVPNDEPDWQRNFRLVDALTGRQVERRIPRLRLEHGARTAIEGFLRQHDLVAKKYVVCAAAGFANVALKTWPPERFGAVLKYVRERHGLRALLVGHEGEKAHLDRVAATADGHAVVWLGREGALLQLAALVGEAALFLGNDTGAMHLAAALDVPVVAVFGGGTWPRFVPAARRSVAVVQPLPCFGCGWDCAFGDAPCIAGITTDDVITAADRLIEASKPSVQPDIAIAVAAAAGTFNEIQRVEHLPLSTRTMMDKAAARYRDTRSGHLARQHKLEELTALDREKDAAIAEKEAEIHTKETEIDALKVVCNEREKTIFTLDGHVRNFQARVATLEADIANLEKTLRELPPEQASAARSIADQAVHIRNIEALVSIRERELAEARASLANREAGRHDLEQAKHYGRLLAEKEAVIRSLSRACEEREAVIKQLSAETTTATAKARKLWTAACAFAREKAWRPFDTWLFATVVERYWMQIGVLRHYDPRPLKWDERLPAPRSRDAELPQIGIVTPSYGQERFIERTLHSVLDQHYAKLRYAVQDGGSKDRSPEIISRYAERLHHWESVKDNGQADAIGRGFKHVGSTLGPNDVMAWLNSDDLLAPGVLRYVGDYFAHYPEVDAIYGHRIIIDDDDHDVGRWIMPRHDPATLEWIDYVPQETLFWRKRAWDLVGGIDPSFQFALDWDLLARFHQAGCKLVRVPYFLGAFRVHAEQKTSQAIHTIGADEMRRIRTRFHGERQDDFATIERFARRARFWGAITSRLHEIGIRW